MIGKSIFLTTLLGAMVVSASVADGQFNVLHSFSNSDVAGFQPLSTLAVDGSTIYGTTSIYDGDGSSGRFFQMNIDGTGVQNLHLFSSHTFPADNGNLPTGPLTQVGSTLFGTTVLGGTNGNGVVYELNSNGTGFQILHAFGSQEPNPVTGLTLGGSVFYGTTGYFSSTPGTIYKLNVDGTAFQSLHSFSGNDGSTAISGLTLSGSTLYGMAGKGGINGSGTLFQMSTDGTGFHVVHAFAGGTADGANPSDGPLVQVGSTLYGTTTSGGENNDGTIFEINTDGTAFHVLHSFNGLDGKAPTFGLTLVGSALYGMTASGGAINDGTIFQINTDGIGFQSLHSFNGIDGANPQAGLTLSGSTLYGTTANGGSGNNAGIVFSITIPEPSSLMLAALGFAGLAAWGWRHRRAVI